MKTGFTEAGIVGGFGAAVVAAGMVFAGCSALDTTSAVEDNDLGIVEVDIDHGEVNGERLLTVRGLDEDGRQVAIATLRTGMVLYGADMTERLHPGTELIVTVGDTTTTFANPDRLPHDVVEPPSHALASFIHLPEVAAAIKTEAGIGFKPLAGSTEVAFGNAQACSGSRFPTNKGNSTNCCQWDQYTGHRVAGSNALGIREGFNATAPPCRNSNGTTGCTDNCTYGPCGMKVDSTTGSNAKLFHPVGYPNACGFDDNGTASGGVHGLEEYNGSQTLYGGVTSTCGFEGCLPNGQPCYGLGHVCFQSSQCCGGACLNSETGFVRADAA